MAIVRAPLIIINAVGLTGRLLEHAPRLKQLAKHGWWRPLEEVLPAVTATAQATMLTGKSPQEHGIVANGWLFRDTMEVRFWQQSNRLLQAEPIYRTIRRVFRERGESFTCAKLFWWFNQGADVNISVTPKPYYGADGNKIFGILSDPPEWSRHLEEKFGKFPFHTFWGPMAGLPCTRWIAQAAGETVRRHCPDLTLVYLPHLDYDPQRHGPAGCNIRQCVQELDDACKPLLDAAEETDSRVWVVSEYGHCDVTSPIFPNRTLREAGFLKVRGGPFGENVETFQSRAFAVCDHQLCHVYVRDEEDLAKVRELLEQLDGVDQVFAGSERANIQLDHSRSGDLVLLSKPDRWFAYPFWFDDRMAPDFARTVDIHRKIGFDPCEMFMDPKSLWPKGRAMRRLLQKKLGFRTLFDVIPLDASIVRGSHGLRARDPLDGPLLIADTDPPAEASLPMTKVYDLLLEQFIDSSP